MLCVCVCVNYKTQLQTYNSPEFGCTVKAVIPRKCTQDCCYKPILTYTILSNVIRDSIHIQLNQFQLNENTADVIYARTKRE